MPPKEATAIAIESLERERDAAMTYAVSLQEVLRDMVEEKCDYMRRNKLGNPELEHNVKWARKVLAQGCHEIGTGSNDQRRPAAIQQGGNGVLLSDSSGPRGSDAKSEAPSEGVSGATNPGHAVGTGWVAFADREPPWDYENGVQFAAMLPAKGGRVELDTVMHPNYAKAGGFTHWRPLSEVLSQVSKQGADRG